MSVAAQGTLIEAGSEQAFLQFSRYTSECETAFDHAVAFFADRIEIEKHYLANLDKLANRTMRDTAVRGLTTSDAWGGAGILSQSLSKAHVRLVETLTQVLKDLDTQRKSQKKTMKDLRTRVRGEQQAYKELKSETVPRLKQSYLRKCKELEAVTEKEGAVSQKSMKIAKELTAADTSYRSGVQELEESRYRFNLLRDRAAKDCELSERNRIIATKSALVKLSEAEKMVVGDRLEAVDIFEPFIECIKPDVDVDLIAPEFRHIWPEAQPVLYQNHTHGDAKHMSFGVPLETSLRHKTIDSIPAILHKCITAVEKRGLDREGIYRIPGKQTDILQLKHQLEADVDRVDLDREEGWDINVVAALVKMFLRELPVALFPVAPKERREYSELPDDASRIKQLRMHLKHISGQNQAVLQFVLEHLANVISHSLENKMSSQNIALIFTPVLFGQPEVQGADGVVPESGGRLATFLSNLSGSGQQAEAAKPDLSQFAALKSDRLLEDLITFRRKIFAQALHRPTIIRQKTDSNSSSGSTSETPDTVAAPVAPKGLLPTPQRKSWEATSPSRSSVLVPPRGDSLPVDGGDQSAPAGMAAVAKAAATVAAAASAGVRGGSSESEALPVAPAASSTPVATSSAAPVTANTQEVAKDVSPDSGRRSVEVLDRSPADAPGGAKETGNAV
ncbi:hypothetical protein HK097_008587 [Rhizophlyctis rosea]|uniref:Rho-GAP domain-containing protein n=1 Tax=Rhizophlyctis rosea TaxID=64517 RepID=A0AAD5SJ14_9FUNG|nr:hypothetical protein HK097_008587 [Rhizophlyctis rosea]